MRLLGGAFVLMHGIVTDHLCVRSGTLFNLNGFPLLTKSLTLEPHAWLVSVPVGSWAWTWTRWRFRWFMLKLLVGGWWKSFAVGLVLGFGLAFLFFGFSIPVRPR